MSCQIRKMRMMSSGTCEPRPATGASAEMAAKLAQMQAERGRQDQMWQTTKTSEKTTYASSTTEIMKTNNTPRLY